MRQLDLEKELKPFRVDSVTMCENEKRFKQQILRHREDMFKNGPDPFEWPLFKIRVTNFQKQSVVHFCVSLFIMDGISDLAMRRILSGLYDRFEEIHPLQAVDLTYRDYNNSMCDSQTGIACSPRYQKSLNYWKERVRTLPDAPELPTIPTTNTQEFDHIGNVLDRSRYRRLREIASRHAVTPTAVLLTIYAVTLGRYARHREMLLNILHCLRHPVRIVREYHFFHNLYHKRVINYENPNRFIGIMIVSSETFPAHF